ncbi:MV entry-fusion complex protein [Cotia virus SPAn232]|uniref:MV entry-fusion complex protein n=2 Tax=Cotia virus TaxID=39444 RepID=H6TAJ7_9POXV|nr:MV entry-fusion complex protein [Cotia virus SPAn232]AFB76934.1 MV entry-fusion complex protein [Cotia virus SPAn232]AIT70673.1 MV entry-fusion complex protein [Cotia virus]
MIVFIIFIIAFSFCTWLSYSFLKPYINYNKNIDI